ncbi:hypothetical protein MKK75_29900 [Methylobacterium sp. J-030]|uniref:hypothetical protein n=1 Tax=Methylobacterium sp. J-030 TaxID=2836627 RepID=UPI001FBA0C7D|nr:hypothetical protein [Methylobacterium sp. J-030]MCJ2072959.1 hypothetical protein [Methylobacterium sp. J-030]
MARLTPPRRGKRFDRGTRLGRVLHMLHADGALSLVLINLPDCYASIAAFRRHPNPDVLHLLRTLARIQVPAALTVTCLWRPDADAPDASGALVTDLTAYLPDCLKVPPHEEAQCIEALLLGVAAAADVPGGGIGLIIDPH